MVVAFFAFFQLYAEKVSPELEKLQHTFRSYHLKKIVPKHHYLPFASDALELDPHSGLLPREILQKHILDIKEYSKCVKVVRKARSALKKVSKQKRLETIDKFHRDLSSRLATLESGRKWATLSFGHIMAHESNVGMLQDGLVDVSGKSGSVHRTNFMSELQGRYFPWGRLSLELGFNSVHYSEISLKERNKVDIIMNIHDYYNLPGKFESIDFYLNTRTGFYKKNDKTDYALSVISPGFLLTMNSRELSRSLFNFSRSSLNVYLEILDYRKLHLFDIEGRDKDTLAFHTEYALQWHQPYKKFIYHTDLLLHLNVSNSDSKDLDYNEISLELGHRIKWREKPFDIYGLLHLAQKTSYSYLSKTRDDTLIDFKFQLNRYLSGSESAITIQYEHERNQSDFDLFTYTNNQISAGFTCKW